MIITMDVGIHSWDGMYKVLEEELLGKEVYVPIVPTGEEGPKGNFVTRFSDVVKSMNCTRYSLNPYYFHTLIFVDTYKWLIFTSHEKWLDLFNHKTFRSSTNCLNLEASYNAKLWNILSKKNELSIIEHFQV